METSFRDALDVRRQLARFDKGRQVGKEHFNMHLVEWRGWHYRETEHDLLRYWPSETVTIRPSPVSEALVWVYWKQEILCQAVAEELCHKDGTYRPYWFPYL